MPPVRVDAVVRLKEDVLTHALSSGDEGVVQSVWLSPREFLCEVEFRRAGRTPPVRAMLRVEQLEVVK